MEYLGFINKELILFTIAYTAIVLALNFIWLHRKEWIKEFISEQWDKWKSHSGLKKTYFVLASIAVPIFLYSFRFIFPEFLNKIDDGNTSFYNLSLAIFAILSGLGAVFGFYTSIVRTETAEQGQITDRLNKAIENLGKITAEGDKPVIEVRIGALYALERIAQDSFRDHIQIMEIFCTYIRYNSPRIKTMKKLRDDIQTALEIIGRRDEWPEGKKRLKQEIAKGYSLNLGGCNLNYSKIRKANFENAKLHFTNLNHAWFNDTNLNNVWFNGAELEGARFNGATTVETHAQIGDFSKCLTFTQEQINTMFLGVDVKLGKDVKLQKDLIHPQKGTKYYKKYNTFDDFMEAYDEWSDAQP